MSNIYGKGLRGKATMLHAQVVRARGRCERCGKSGIPMQCAHIMSRRHAATRTDERNAWCLCVACHMTTGERAWEFMALVDKTIGQEAFEELRARAMDASFKPKPWFWGAEVERLTELLKEAA